MSAMPNLFEIAGRHADIYESLYREASQGGVGEVSAGAAAGILKRSHLPNPVLAKVWDVADSHKSGFLDKAQFFAALKLISLAQNGAEIAATNLRMELPPPQIEGHAAPPPQGPPVLNNNPPMDDWLIKPSDRTKYESIFTSLSPVEGKLGGDSVRPVLLNSGLPQATLGRIWTLADLDRDGKLDRDEMCVALHLVYKALEGEPVPNTLPPNLVPPSKRSGSRRSSIQGDARSRSGSIASVDHGFSANGPQYQQHGYSAHGIRSLTATPVQMEMTNSPMHGSRGSLSSPAKAPHAADWVLDAAKHQQLFTQLDTNADGLVSGGDVKGVLMGSGMGQGVLAHIWGLVDMNKTGMLNPEQFALIMHLIEGKTQRNEDPPPSLPPNLVPPSMRTADGGGEGALAENKQVVVVEAELGEIRASLRSLEASTVEVEAGMAVKQSEVKNLEIELHTLQSTVAQLERQQGEANRRLANLDAQRDALRRTAEELGGKLASDEAETAAARTELDTSSSTAAEAEEELNRRRGELAAAREEESRAEVRLQMEKANLDTQAQNHGGIESAVHQTETNIRTLETSNALLTETLGKLEALLANPAGADQVCLLPIERPTLNTLMKAPGENKWKNSGYQGSTFAQKPAAFTPHRPPPPAAVLYDIVPTDHSASTSAQPDPFQATPPTNGGFGDVDPFASSGGAADPFGGEDPFASSGGTNGGDPFGGGAAAATDDPFASSNGGGTEPFADASENVAPKKPPPPRPAPPKGRSSGAATPVNEADAFGEDPFAAKTAAPSGGDGFGNFADFGSFS